MGKNLNKSNYSSGKFVGGFNSLEQLAYNKNEYLAPQSKRALAKALKKKKKRK
tara:strand:- start:360 stop:518 length:159 start_codon:yes stop_codon:yes gene_type:complete